jgi:hypothetical protein
MVNNLNIKRLTMNEEIKTEEQKKEELVKTPEELQKVPVIEEYVEETPVQGS